MQIRISSDLPRDLLLSPPKIAPLTLRLEIIYYVLSMRNILFENVSSRKMLFLCIRAVKNFSHFSFFRSRWFAILFRFILCPLRREMFHVSRRIENNFSRIKFKFEIVEDIKYQTRLFVCTILLAVWCEETCKTSFCANFLCHWNMNSLNVPLHSLKWFTGHGKGKPHFSHLSTAHESSEGKELLRQTRILSSNRIKSCEKRHHVQIDGRKNVCVLP